MAAAGAPVSATPGQEERSSSHIPHVQQVGQKPELIMLRSIAVGHREEAEVGGDRLKLISVTMLLASPHQSYPGLLNATCL